MRVLKCGRNLVKIDLGGEIRRPGRRSSVDEVSWDTGALRTEDTGPTRSIEAG